MTEAHEVAQAIIEQHPGFFPVQTRQHAVSIATGQMPEESFQAIQAVADAIMELQPCAK